MRVLCIETSSPAGGVAITEDGILCAELIVNSTETYSRRLLASVESLFAQLNLGWNDLGGIAVCTGPGSFTGIRIGIATAKGLALALGSGLTGVSSLDALAVNASGLDENAVIAPVMDAKRGQIYTALYEFHPDAEPFRLCEPMAIKPDVISSLFPSDRRVFVLGNGIHLLNAPELQSRNRKIIFLPEQFSFIRPWTLGLLAHQRNGFEHGCDIDSIDAMYLRPSDAELNRKV